jgi:DNA-binding response OmpR family regulator
VTHLPVEAIAVRLADEGVPLRAIARATSTPSDTLRTKLHEAQAQGRLLELPRDDWPPGFPRDQRALQLSRMVTQNPEAVTLAMQKIFGLTATEVGLLMTLIQNTSVPKTRINNMAHRTIDVHICHIRARLHPFGIAIATLWGYGYQLPVDDRRKVMDLILADVSDSAV